MDPTTTSNPSAAGAGYPQQPSSNGKPAFSTTSASVGAGVKVGRGIGPIPPGKAIKIPHTPKPARKKSAIPLATAIAAATRMGNVVLDVRALKDEAVLGKFIEQSGAKDLGRFRIALSAQRVDDIDRVLTELDAETKQAGGAAAVVTRLAIQRARIEAVDTTTKIGLAMLEAEDPPESTAIRPPVLPGFGSAIQINVGQGGSVTTPPHP